MITLSFACEAGIGRLVSVGLYIKNLKQCYLLSIKTILSIQE